MTKWSVSKKSVGGGEWKYCRTYWQSLMLLTTGFFTTPSVLHPAPLLSFVSNIQQEEEFCKTHTLGYICDILVARNKKLQVKHSSWGDIPQALKKDNPQSFSVLFFLWYFASSLRVKKSWILNSWNPDCNFIFQHVSQKNVVEERLSQDTESACMLKRCKMEVLRVGTAV